MAASVLSAPMASIGVPKEIKLDEQRVALTPDAVRELVSQGLEVRIETGAGAGAGIGDEAFAAAGAQLVSRDEAWGAHLVVKVKEPQTEEFAYLRKDMVLFTYLHLAAYPSVGEALLEAGTAAIAYETVQLENGSLPLLAPMSEIAGRLAAQVGAHLLEKPHGGRGVLIGGCTGVQPARVVVLGAGTVGWNAARTAAAMDAAAYMPGAAHTAEGTLNAADSTRHLARLRAKLEQLATTARTARTADALRQSKLHAHAAARCVHERARRVASCEQVPHLTIAHCCEMLDEVRALRGLSHTPSTRAAATRASVPSVLGGSTSVQQAPPGQRRTTASMGWVGEVAERAPRSAPSPDILPRPQRARAATRAKPHQPRGRPNCREKQV